MNDTFHVQAFTRAAVRRRCTLGLLLLSAFASTAHAAVTVGVATGDATPTAGGVAFALTLTVNNPDPQVATNVVLTNPLPNNIVMNTLTIAGAQAGSFSCVAPPSGENGTVVCRAPSFPANGTAVITLSVSVDEESVSGNRTNTARVVSGGNQSSGSVALSLQNDASLTLSHNAPGSARAGERISYLTRVINNGDSSAVNANVNISVPAGARFVGVLTTGAFTDTCVYTPGTTTVTCFANRLGVGAHHINVLLALDASLAPGMIASAATLTAGVGSVAGSPANAQTTIVP